MNLSEKAAGNLMALREKKPLIHNITNYVVRHGCLCRRIGS